MAVYRPKNRVTFEYDFQVDGCRFRGNTHQVDRALALKAEVVARQEAQASLLRAMRQQWQGPFVYFVECEGAVKIGLTMKPRERFIYLRIGNPRPLKLLALTPGTREHERALHARFADARLCGEWYLATGELLELIQKYREEYGG